MKLTSSLWRRRNAPSIETKKEIENENKILFRPRDYGSNAKAGGKYKGVLTNLMMERSMSYKRQISYYINADIDKIMRRLS